MLVSVAATAAAIIVVAVAACGKARFGYLHERVHLVVICGNKLFGVAVHDDLHDIDLLLTAVIAVGVFR